MSKKSGKSWFNPKRIKICTGIILIIIFALVLDFTAPVGKRISHDIHSYDDQLYKLSGFIDSYFEKHGRLPIDLFGGDKAGFRIKDVSFVDPLIDSQIINSYPEIQSNSIKTRRALLDFKQNHPEYLYLFGKNGNSTCNIKHIKFEDVKNQLNQNHEINPFTGCFFYAVLSDTQPFSYDLRILCDTSGHSTDISDYDELKEFIYSNPSDSIAAFNDVNTVIHGIICTYRDGYWKKAPFSYRSVSN